MMLKHVAMAAALAVTLAFAGCAQSETTPGESGEAAAVTETLTIDTAGGPVRFDVEIADDYAERERGLMFRETLADDHGMLFDFERPQRVSFWMRNTMISLDIIFIGADGRILNIAERATPYSEDDIPSAGPALGVLEIRGGRAAELGIRPGDRVRHRIFER